MVSGVNEGQGSVYAMMCNVHLRVCIYAAQRL